MSTTCDSCKLTVNAEEGCARLLIRDPAPDYSDFTKPPMPPRRLPELDLCAACIAKLIEALELPADTFTPRPAPASDESPALTSGALSIDDLRRLGLVESEDEP